MFRIAGRLLHLRFLLGCVRHRASERRVSCVGMPRGGGYINVVHSARSRSSVRNPNVFVGRKCARSVTISRAERVL